MIRTLNQDIFYYIYIYIHKVHACCEEPMSQVKKKEAKDSFVCINLFIFR